MSSTTSRCTSSCPHCQLSTLLRRTYYVHVAKRGDINTNPEVRNGDGPKRTANDNKLHSLAGVISGFGMIFFEIEFRIPEEQRPILLLSTTIRSTALPFYSAFHTSSNSSGDTVVVIVLWREWISTTLDKDVPTGCWRK